MGRRLGARGVVAAFGAALALVLPFGANVAGAAASCSISWDGGGSTQNWIEAANWTDDRVPVATDAVCIDTPDQESVVYLRDDVTIARLVNTETLRHLAGRLEVTDTSAISRLGAYDVNGGTLAGAGRRTVDRDSTWMRLTIDGPGVTSIAEGTTVRIPPETDVTLDDGVIHNGVVRNAGTVRIHRSSLEGSATFFNDGTLRISDSLIDGHLVNRGTVRNERVIGERGLGHIQGRFDNQGIVETVAPFLAVNAAGDDDGEYRARAGTEVILGVADGFGKPNGVRYLRTGLRTTGPGEVRIVGGAFAGTNPAGSMLVVDASVVHASGRLQNDGILRLRNDAVVAGADPSAALENDGLIISDSRACICLPFDNDGIARSTSETLRLTHGSSARHADTGELRADAGAAITIGQSYSEPLPTRRLASTALTTGEGDITLTGGRIAGTIGPRFVARLAGGGYDDATRFAPGTVNYGTVAPETRRMEIEETFTNNGVLLIDDEFVDATSDDAFIVNFGVITTTATNASACICPPVDNHGIVRTTSGYIMMGANSANGFDTGTYSLAKGTAVNILGGGVLTKRLGPGFRTTGAGEFEVVGADLTGTVPAGSTVVARRYEPFAIRDLVNAGRLYIERFSALYPLAVGSLHNTGIVSIEGGNEVVAVDATSAITNAGTLFTTGPEPVVVHVPLDNTGVVDVRSGALTLGGNSPDGVDTGAYRVASGSTLAFDLTASARTIADRSTLDGGGELVVRGGSLHAGPTIQWRPGTLSFHDDATLDVHLSASAHPQFEVAGPATIAGAVHVSLDGGFCPVAGERFRLVSAASRTGTWATVTSDPGSPSFAVEKGPRTIGVVAGAEGCA